MHGNEMSLCDNLPEGDLWNVQGDLSPGWARRSGGGSAVAGRMGLDPRKVALKSPGDVRARDWRAGAADEWDLPPLSPLQLKIICSLHIEIGPTIQVQVMGSDKPSEQIWGSALSRKHLLGTQKTKPKALHVKCYQPWSGLKQTPKGTLSEWDHCACQPRRWPEQASTELKPGQTREQVVGGRKEVDVVAAANPGFP